MSKKLVFLAASWSLIAAAGVENQPAKRTPQEPIEPAVRAVEFESRKVYQSSQRPSYTSWVSFFPGEEGRWYVTCEEVTRPEKPLPQCSREQWYEMALPVGYDKSQHKMEMVMLESGDNLKTWRVISRAPCRFHHSAGSFGQARTKDGRFLQLRVELLFARPVDQAQ